MKPTIQSISDTGTKYGVSYWLNWLDCPEKARRRALEKKTPGLSGIEPIDVGTVGHALLNMYYTSLDPDCFDTRVIKWTDPAETPQDYQAKVYQEADRMFQAYRFLHTAKELGRVTASEKFYEIKDFLGILHTFTLRPDLEVHMTEKKARELNLPGAGHYQIDHKFFGRETGLEPTYCQFDLRFAAYNEAWKQVFPRKKFRGTIVNALFRYRDPVFKRYFIPASGLGRQRLKIALTEAVRNEEKYLGDKPALTKPHLCVNRFSHCQFIHQCKGV